MPSSLELLEPRIAPATLLPGGRAVQYTDGDGDLVTIAISKGRFEDPNAVGQTDFVFGITNTGVGEQLQILRLAGNPAFDGAALSITARPGPGGGDGVVNVGYIDATGLDLASVLVRGDLGAIDAGDTVSDAALGSLSVLSLGVEGTSTGAPDLKSDFLGPVGAIKVTGDIFNAVIVVDGVLPSGRIIGNLGSFTVGGSIFGGSADGSGQLYCLGTLGPVRIGGDLGGGDGAASGLIRAKKIASVTIGGTLVGGDGGDSGQIFSETSLGPVRIGGAISGSGGAASGFIAGKTISSIVVGNSVFGGTGAQSGGIRGETLGTVTIGGSLVGGDGLQSGKVTADTTLTKVTVSGGLFGGDGEFSGAIGAQKIVSVTIGSSVTGGSGESSGSIQTNGDLNNLKVLGALVGGRGNYSGMIFAGGTLGTASIAGNVFGGSDDGTNFLAGSGYIEARRIGQLTIGGSVFSGDNNGGGVASCGAIRSATDIVNLTIRGSLEGRNSPVIISAVGQPNATGATDLAIRNLTIGGRVYFTEILAGYSPDLTNSIYGEPVNADAQIGTVKVGGDWLASDLIAGLHHGGDLYFGDTTDTKISGAGVKDLDDSKTISRISAIVIGGRVIGTTAPDDTYRTGFGAQHVVRITVGGATVLPIKAGSGNDTFATLSAYPLGTTLGSVGSDSRDVHVFEV